MSILTKSAIQNAMEAGQIVISPFHEIALTPNGYDLHLGKNMLMLQPGRDVDVRTDLTNKYREVHLEPDGSIRLEPGRLYLGVTQEYTATLNHLPIMEGKSSLARMGISVHCCAGFGDVGFCGHWTLEITVTNPTTLIPGMPIGQLVYHTIEGDAGVGYNKTGSYNNTGSENPMPGIPNMHKKTEQFITV